MTPTDVWMLRGDGEPFNARTNMLWNVANTLDPKRNVIKGDIQYPDTISLFGAAGLFGASEAESVEDGCDELGKIASGAPIGLLAYSLGGLVASRFLTHMAAGAYPDARIAWVGFVANPARAVGESIDPNPVYNGINGGHGPWPHNIPVFTAANPDDVITSCPPESPWRIVAKGLQQFDVGMLALNQLPADARELLGYLSGAEHFRAYPQEGYCARLGARINGLPV